MSIKLKKTLYVGIGGTGVSTILKVKKHFVDSYGEVPPMIGFLCIDTDGAATSKSITSNRGRQIKLESSELLVCTVKGALSVYQNNLKKYDWVPSKNVVKLTNIQGGGAGQVRSNGRFIAYFNNTTIKDNIQSAVNNVMRLIPQGSAYEVDVNSDGVDFPVNVNVVASVAGGTGSGMLVDMLCIIREALKQLAVDFRIYPWIVLPEVFRTMNAGPSMDNVLYNCYGALRTLDYLEHYVPNQPAISFGYSKVDEPLFDYAYVINNTNKAGVSFDSLEDITDVIAKSAFLPANKMGDEISSPFDNITAQKMAGTYDILQKKAWAASASSAEMIYDSQAVGRAYANRIISQLCNSMLQSPDDGVADANRFVDDPDVMIRENEGRDDVIDNLLSPNPEYSFEIDENTQTSDIMQYLENNYGTQHLEQTLQDNLRAKVDSTETHFKEYLDDIMSRKEGKVGGALRFISSLQQLIDICKGEIKGEKESYAAINQQPKQWDVLLNAVTNKGIVGLFKKINNDAVEILQNELARDIKSNREEIRREWTLKFYASLENIINDKKRELETLSTFLRSISEEGNKMLLTELNSSKSLSKFQIALHPSAIAEVDNYSIDEAVKTQFLQFLGSGMASWLGASEKTVKERLWRFAERTNVVQNALATKINDVLRNMPDEELKKKLKHLQTLAAPLWTYNTRGFNDQSRKLDSFVVVGVDNRDTSILATDPRYNTFFNTNQNKASFASTNQSDRVYLLVVEDLLPIYAVNNFTAYERDYEERVMRNVNMSNYIDEKLNNRINSENFSLTPQVETDNVLQLWVYGFIFGYTHYDVEKNKYWIRSKRMGDPLRSFRFDLGSQRDVAYDIFRSEQLYKEVEDALNKQIAKTGRQPIEDKINVTISEGSYQEKYAQLSPIEESQIYEPKFKAVKELLEQEVRLMSE